MINTHPGNHNRTGKPEAARHRARRWINFWEQDGVRLPKGSHTRISMERKKCYGELKAVRELLVDRHLPDKTADNDPVVRIREIEHGIPYAQYLELNDLREKIEALRIEIGQLPYRRAHHQPLMAESRMD